MPIGPASFHLADQLWGPGVVLAPLGAHPSIGGAQLLGVRGDPAPRVEVRRLERADDRPAQPEPVAHDSVYVLDRGDAVAHEAVRFPQQGALQAVEHEALHLLAHADRREPGALEDPLGARDGLGAGEGGGQDLDDG